MAKVIGSFISTEAETRGSGARYRYPVEKLSSGEELFILRPARKGNFDFKVEVLPSYKLGKGSHKDIASDFEGKKRDNLSAFRPLWKVVTELHDCKESGIDVLLGQAPELAAAFQDGARADVLLKVLKWMFIMEDIIFWSYLGRSKLYNYLKEIAEDPP